jgi:hypothetical protein
LADLAGWHTSRGRSLRHCEGATPIGARSIASDATRARGACGGATASARPWPRAASSWGLGSHGTSNGWKPAIPVAAVLLAANKGRLCWHGHLCVRNMLLHKPQLVRRFVQRYGSNLLSDRQCCLNPIFCSHTLSHPFSPAPAPMSHCRSHYSSQVRINRPLSVHDMRGAILPAERVRKLSAQSALLRSMRKERRRVNEVHQDR